MARSLRFVATYVHNMTDGEVIAVPSSAAPQNWVGSSEYHSLTEYRREVIAFAVAFHPVSQSCGGPLPISFSIVSIYCISIMRPIKYPILCQEASNARVAALVVWVSNRKNIKSFRNSRDRYSPSIGTEKVKLQVPRVFNNLWHRLQNKYGRYCFISRISMWMSVTFNLKFRKWIIRWAKGPTDKAPTKAEMKAPPGGATSPARSRGHRTRPFTTVHALSQSYTPHARWPHATRKLAPIDAHRSVVVSTRLNLIYTEDVYRSQTETEDTSATRTKINVKAGGAQPTNRQLPSGFQSRNPAKG
ncbi:hypothetical protein EVAR_24770_1 [Eumeta japonica]|uniref:Uncharacterized protein n=1 Tax=Eumeta variegata TaxID=151549 RepID=A0A4C1W453_EUMVA|nr:hypothetical protein EVAR_24770_1 [Eumeta japonica]